MHRLTMLTLAALVLCAQASAVDAPRALVAETDVAGSDGTTIVLDWVDTNGGSVATIVERSTDNRHYAPIAEVPAGQVRYEDTGLDHGQLFLYRVHPKGAPTQRSNWNFAATTPAEPFVEGEGGPEFCWARVETSGDVAITWLDPLIGEEYYVVERRAGTGDYVEIARLPPDTTSYTDTGLNASGAVAYRVRALVLGPDVDSDGDEIPHYSAAATTLVIGYVSDLPVPDGLGATQVHTSQVELSWDAVAGATGYLLEVSKDRGKTYATLGTTDGATSFTHIGTFIGMEYRYRIRATDADGVSLPSSALVLTPSVDTGVACPTDLVASENADGDIVLTWSDNADNETGYAIEQRSGSATWERIATVGADITTYTADGYPWDYYRVQALGVDGDSRYSWPDKASGGPAQAGPTGLAVTGRTTSSITLSWTPADGYVNQSVQRSHDGGPFRTIAFLGSSDTSYTDWELPTATTYSYRIVLTGQSTLASDPIATSTKTASGTPDAPSLLAATAVAREQINLLWNDRSDNETGFEIQRAPDGGSFSTVATVAANVHGWCDTGLSAGATYDYRVRATSASGDSGWSGSDGATTLANDPVIDHADTQHPTYRALEITGTAANDSIHIAAAGQDLTVTANGNSVVHTGPYQVIIVRGGAGADSIELAKSVTQRAYLYGDEHDDSLTTAGSGRCFLVAVGGGADILVGNGVDSTYWCDPLDTVEASPRERHWQRVHCIERFEPFWTRDPSKSKFITTEPDGREWNDSADWPHSGINEAARYPDAPFWGDSPVMFDVNQGLLQNCPLTGYYQCVADQQPERIADAAIPLGDGTYAVHCGDGASAVYARVDGDVGSGWMGTLGPQGQQWFLILEKVYSGFGMPSHKPSATTAGPLPNGQSLYFEGDPEKLYDLIRGALDRDEIVLCWTTGDPLDVPTVRQGHNHGIVEAYRDETGEPHVIIRNPYGVNITGWDSWPLHRTNGLMRMSVAHLQGNFISGSISSWAPASRCISLQVSEPGPVPLPIEAVLEPGPMRVTPDDDETHTFTGLAPTAEHRIRPESIIGGNG